MTEAASDNTVGPYRLERILSSGGQTQVWLAQGPAGAVALKIARGEAHKDSLAREIRALELAGAHPHLVRLLDKAPDSAWLALERAQGLAWHKWAVMEGVAEIAEVAAQLALVLEHLHARGVVHADLKPGNVLVDVDGTPKLLDLGIASLTGDAPRGFKGSPGFAAPEILRGERPTTATDVYGLGAALYACLTGQPPFASPDPATLAYLPLVSLPEPPNAIRAEIPALLSQLILAMLARDPSRRPTDLAKLADMLRRAATSPVGTPVIGMRSVREELRRAVVGAVDGECRVVVLYGPPGTGRRTLLTEAVEAARREGLAFLKEADPPELLAALRGTKRASVMALRSTQPGVVAFARGLIDHSVPALVLLHSDRPLPGLGSRAMQVTPPPLMRDEAERLIEVLGGPTDEVETWWRASFGHPVALLGRWRAARRSNGELRNFDRDLPSASRKILQALRRADEIAIPALALKVGMGEHELLDQCEALFAEGLAEPASNGSAIRLAAAGRRPVTEIPE